MRINVQPWPIRTDTPDFAIAASGNPLDTVTSYHLQVFSDTGMQNLVAEKLSLARAAGQTVWTLPVTLADNTQYFWRVSARNRCPSATSPAILFQDGFENAQGGSATSTVFSFTTVLGPEANDDHRNHFHLDLAPRRHKPFCE